MPVLVQGAGWRTRRDGCDARRVCAGGVSNLVSFRQVALPRNADLRPFVPHRDLHHGPAGLPGQAFPARVVSSAGCGAMTPRWGFTAPSTLSCRRSGSRRHRPHRFGPEHSADGYRTAPVATPTGRIVSDDETLQSSEYRQRCAGFWRTQIGFVCQQHEEQSTWRIRQALFSPTGSD